MALDGVKNFAKVEVSTGYNDSATSIVLSAGEGAKLPDPATANYNLVWWNSTDYPDPSDDPKVEIVRATALSTDTLTVVRNQESSGASTKNTADKVYLMILCPTAKMITDIGTELAKIITWAEITGTSQQAVVNYGYVANNGSLITITLPDTAPLGSILKVAGLGAGGWKIAQNASEYIYFGNQTTTTGAGGYLASTASKDAVELVCVVANTGWAVLSAVGNITYA